jgi:DNA (cytosine-5)-methyltransferase 1
VEPHGTKWPPNNLKTAIYTASDYGVPQKRDRVILIGVKKNSKIKLDDIYYTLNSLKTKENVKTVFDAIGHLPKFTPLVSKCKLDGKNVSHKLTENKVVEHHQCRFHNARDLKIFKLWLENNMNEINNREKINFYNNLMNKKSNHNKYRNLEWDKPSPTIVAHLQKDGLMFIHPDLQQLRSITVKEAALLQSFPNDFTFQASQAKAYKMIGNAVPPLFAYSIAMAIVKTISKK